MNKSKVLLILCSVLLFTACQRTPEELVVQNKADDELKEAIAVTAEPIAETVQETAIPEQAVIMKESHTNDTGTLTVNFDAEVASPEISQIPVAYIEQLEITQEQLERIITAFFGDAQFYDPAVYTKSELEDSIVRIRQSAADLNSDFAQSKGIDNLADLQKAVDKQVASLEKEWRDAPEAEPVISTSGIAKSDHFYAKTKLKNKDDIGYLSYSDRVPFVYIKCFGTGGVYGWREKRLEVKNSTEIELDMGEAEFQSARHLAESVIQRAEIEGVKLGEAYLFMDNTGNGIEGADQKASGVTGGREFYVFCFERIAGEGTVDKTFHTGLSSEDEYSEPWAYEEIQVWVENGEVVQFIWDSPAKIGAMVNENAQIQVGYTQAMELAYQHLFVKYADLRSGKLKDMVIDIDKIEFELVRIKERDSGNYLVIPAWKFYGEISGRYTEEALKEGYYGASADYVPLNEPESKNLVTVNALDGTVIDMRLGY